LRAAPCAGNVQPAAAWEKQSHEKPEGIVEDIAISRFILAVCSAARIAHAIISTRTFFQRSSWRIRAVAETVGGQRDFHDPVGENAPAGIVAGGTGRHQQWQE